MKRLLLIILMLCIVIVNDVNAGCNERDLRVLANAITIEYELIEDDYYYYDLYFYNLSDELYLINKENRTMIKKPKEGNVYVERIYGLNKVLSTTFEIYATNINCFSGKLSEINLKLPRYNELTNTDLCKNNPNIDQCYKLINEESIYSYKDLANNINLVKKDSKIIIDNKDGIPSLYIYIGGGVIVMGLITTIFLFKKKNNRGII